MQTGDDEKQTGGEEPAALKCDYCKGEGHDEETAACPVRVDDAEKFKNG